MLIELQEPFRSKWKKGYLRISNENRRIVDLFNSNSDRTTISYARYLMGIKLGYEVPDDFEVDHKDDDKTNDDINNLQLLSQEQNLLKQQWWYSAMVVQWTIVPCDNCRNLFYITQGEINNRIRKGVQHLFCSRSCSARFHNTISKNSPFQNNSR
jgi:hypothetical protein